MSAKNAISIPLKIKRSPTDILKVLSKTVELEGNTTHYSVIDDTFLSHNTLLDKKKNYLARASGIKAAKYVMEQYPAGFMNDICEPHVPKFFPDEVFTEEELKFPTEDLIYKMMSWKKIKQAVDTYRKCKDIGVEVSEACKLTLLDFLCINNSKDPVKSPMYETWFLNSSLSPWEIEKLSKINMQSSWKKDDEADFMFNELTEKNAQAYCALIKGMTKHLEVKESLRLYNEMKEKNLIPDLSTFSELIKIYRYVDETNEKKTDFIMQILNEIKSAGLSPNLMTFNNTLNTISNFGIDQNSVIFALNILKEMKNLGIEPSLATWSSILTIFYPNRGIGGKTGILAQVIDEVEKMDMSKNGIEWKDINDANFFKNAIDRTLNFAQNAPQMHRIHTILMRNNNIKFLNNDLVFNNYFDLYISSLIKYETPEVVISEWRKLTPNIHVRGSKLLIKMIQYTIDYKCFDFIPEIWSNFIEGRFKRNKDFSEQTISAFLNVMAEYETEDSLLDNYGAIAEIMMTQYPYLEFERPAPMFSKDATPTFSFSYQWTPKMLSNFFIIAARTNKVDLLADSLDTFFENQTKIPGEISEKSIEMLFDIFMREKKIDQAIKATNLAGSYQLSNLVVRFMNELKSLKNLSIEQKELINQLRQ